MPKINYLKTAANKAEASNAALIRLIWGAKACAVLPTMIWVV